MRALIVLRSAAMLIPVALAATPAGAINITFDYSRDTFGFFADPARRTLLNQAASYFTPFTDLLSAITPSGTNTFTAIFDNPATGLEDATINLSVPANTLIIYAGGRDIPGSTLGIGGPGGFSGGGSQPFIDAVLTRGQPGATQDPATSTDFGPWGGSITFDTGATWNFSAANPAAGQSDFLSVAIHELAHVLGFGTAESFNYWVSGTSFTGPTAKSKNAGANVPLHTDASHWQNGKTSPLPGSGAVQETAMDPSITVGTRKLFTTLDYAGMDDIGWQVPANLLTAGGPPLIGDTNDDGVVDLIDLNNVLNNFGDTGASPGDDDGNGVVDLADLNRVLNNFGDTAATSALSVIPEPAAATLLLPTLALLARRRKQ